MTRSTPSLRMHECVFPKIMALNCPEFFSFRGWAHKLSSQIFSILTLSSWTYPSYFILPFAGQICTASYYAHTHLNQPCLAAVALLCKDRRNPLAVYQSGENWFVSPYILFMNSILSLPAPDSSYEKMHVLIVYNFAQDTYAQAIFSFPQGIVNSFTMEATFCGASSGPRKGTQFSTGMPACRELPLSLD